MDLQKSVMHKIHMQREWLQHECAFTLDVCGCCHHLNYYIFHLRSPKPNSHQILSVVIKFHIFKETKTKKNQLTSLPKIGYKNETKWITEIVWNMERAQLKLNRT